MKELLASGSSDQSALDQAGHLKRTGANVEQVLDRYRLMIDAIDQALPGPTLFGSDPRIDRLQARRRALAERAKSMAPDAYLNELQGLLVQLADVQAKMDEAQKAHKE